MSEGQLLLLILGLVYLSDCLHFLPRSSAVFRSGWLRFWKLVRPASWLGTPARHAIMTGIMPPFTTLCSCDFVPSWFQEDGLRPPGRKALPWNGIKTTLDGARLVLNNGLTVVCSSRTQAVWLEKTVRTLAAEANPETRRQLWENIIQHSLQLPPARAAARKLQLAIESIRPWGTAVFLLLFVTLPIAYYQLGEHWLVLAFLIMLFGTMVMVGQVFRRIINNLYPAEKGVDLVVKIFINSLLPTHSVRAHDFFGLCAGAGLHPLAMAVVLMDHKRFLPFAAAWWRALSHPSPEMEAEPFFLAHRQAVEQFLVHQKIEPASLEKRMAAEPGALSYCPRCQAQYTFAEGTCKDCGGVPTVPFDKLADANA